MEIEEMTRFTSKAGMSIYSLNLRLMRAAEYKLAISNFDWS